MEAYFFCFKKKLFVKSLKIDLFFLHVIFVCKKYKWYIIFIFIIYTKNYRRKLLKEEKSINFFCCFSSFLFFTFFLWKNCRGCRWTSGNFFTVERKEKWEKNQFFSQKTLPKSMKSSVDLIAKLNLNGFAPKWLLKN